MRVLILFLAAWTSVQAYDILVVLPTPSKSHNILGKGLVDVLLKAGHNITWVTPFPPKKSYNDRLTIVDCSVVNSVLEGIDKKVIDKELNMFNGIGEMMDKMRKTSKGALTPELSNILVEKQFDAVVTEFTVNDFDAGYAAVQQVPWIVLNPTTLLPNLQALLDEPHSVPIIPMFMTDFTVPMNFLERLATSAIYYLTMVVQLWYESVNTAQYQEMFGSIAAERGVSLPPLREALSNISIVFVNSHPSLTSSVSVAPNFIDVAGYHIGEDVPPLPKDFQEILDSSTQGFIYFSMGSIIQSKNFPKETRRKVLAMFSKLPYTVLWKFEDEMMDLPKNVHVRKWMPQSSILAHKNIKAFITHGGMLSNLEAITYGVPLVAVPMIADQSANAERAVRLGYAVKVFFEADTLADELKKGLDLILGDEKYYNRAKELSSLFNDRPVKPAKLISHYVELAIRTKGAYHLRSKAPLYAWYQRAMLDQAVFVGAILTALYFGFKKLVKLVLCKIFGRKNKVKTN